MRTSILRKAKESADTITTFFDREVDRIVAVARDMASAFEDGGRLYVVGSRGSAADAIASEFVHPVTARRPPLPAIALSADVTAIGTDQDLALVHVLRVQARRGDILLALSANGQSRAINRAVGAAKEIGMLVVGFTGMDGTLAALCDHAFVIPSPATHRVQEAHVVLLHLLWDAIHVLRGEEDVPG